MALLFCDIKPRVNFRYDAVKAMREMEDYTQSVGGYPFLYADTFMTRPEFEKMFDLTSKLFFFIQRLAFQ